MMMFAWLAGLLYPACAAPAAQGLPTPSLMALSHLERPASPNNALTSTAYPVPAARLYSAIRMVAAAQPRVFVAAEYPAEMQLHWVARSAVFNFPDLITAQVSPSGPDTSTLLLYSRSVYGYADFGVNRKRVAAWLAGIETTLNQPSER